MGDLPNIAPTARSRNMPEIHDPAFFIECGFGATESGRPATAEIFGPLPTRNKLTAAADVAAWHRPDRLPNGVTSAAIRNATRDRSSARVRAKRRRTPEVIREYICSISWTDGFSGSVLAEWTGSDCARNTLVVFVVDHGYQVARREMVGGGKLGVQGRFGLFEMGKPRCRS